MFAVAIATASQPTHACAKGDRRAPRSFQGALNSVVVVNVGSDGADRPWAPICIVLFGHGKPTRGYHAGRVFGAGLDPVAIVRLWAIFYAFKQAKRPVRGVLVDGRQRHLRRIWAIILGSQVGMGLVLATSVQAYLLMRWMLPH